MNPFPIRLTNFYLIWAFAGLLMTPACTLAASSPACASAAPDSILSCLEHTYATRDFETYRQMLASDFQYRFKDTGWGLEEELTAAERMFHPDSTESMSLTFGSEYKLSDGPEPGTWVLSGLTLTMAIDRQQGGSLRHYEVTNRADELWLRLEAEPTPHILIYRWVSSGE